MRRKLLALCALLTVAPPLFAQSDALVLSPEPGARISVNEVLIALSFTGDNANADAAATKIEIDGRDITGQLEISGSIITWRPNEVVITGPHRVVARTPGKADLSWTFTATPPSKEELARTKASGDAVPPVPSGAWLPHGTIVLSGAASSVSGAGAALRQQDDFQPNMWLNAGGEIASGWRYTAAIYMTGQESSEAQPMNRYRFDLRAPFFKVSVGDVHPFMQDLILAGRRVRGVQGELRAGPLRVGLVSGETRRAIPALVNTADGTVLRTGTFGQNLFAVRPALGSGDRFQAGVTFLHVRDDVGSIPDLRVNNGAQADRSANAPPKDNLVAGFDLTWRMFGGHLMLQYENGISLLANDISNGPLTQTGLDSIMDAAGIGRLDFDPSDYKDWFILNASLIPLDPRGLTNVAQQVRTSARIGRHMLAFEWHSIGGSYHTLGYPALQRDRRGMRISDSFTMLNDALVVSAGYERDNDNLDDVKPATTTSAGGFANLSWQRSRDALMLTASARVGSRTNDLATGSGGAVDETYRALSGGVGIPLTTIAGFRTRLLVNTSLIEREDPKNVEADTRDLYYLGGIEAETPERTSDFSVMYGLNKSEFGSSNTTDYKRLLVSGRHQLSERIAALLDVNHTSATGDANAGVQYGRSELLGGGEFEVLRTTLLTFSAGVISYSDDVDAERNSKETVVRLNLRRAF